MNIVAGNSTRTRRNFDRLREITFARIGQEPMEPSEAEPSVKLIVKAVFNSNENQTPSEKKKKRKEEHETQRIKHPLHDPVSAFVEHWLHHGRRSH